MTSGSTGLYILYQFYIYHIEGEMQAKGVSGFLGLRGMRQQKCRLKVCETKVLRRLLGPKRDEVAGVCRIPHNEELNDLYCSPNIIWVIKSRRVRCVGHVACMGERRGAYRVLVGKPKGQTPVGRLRCRWENNIKMDVQKWDVGAWTG
jgi:hypothetical protein